jgi:hypothetical protein
MDDLTDVQWLVYRLNAASSRTELVSNDIEDQDGMQLTATVVRLDSVREVLEDCWRTLHILYDRALERDRTLSEDRTFSGTQARSGGVVADILSATATGVRADGSAVDHVGGRAADVDA